MRAASITAPGASRALALGSMAGAARRRCRRNRRPPRQAVVARGQRKVVPAGFRRWPLRAPPFHFAPRRCGSPWAGNARRWAPRSVALSASCIRYSASTKRRRHAAMAPLRQRSRRQTERQRAESKRIELSCQNGVSLRHNAASAARKEFQRLFDALLGADLELLVQHDAIFADDPMRTNHAHVFLAIH